MLARHYGFAIPLGVAACGGAMWLLANIANATLFDEKGCEPVIPRAD